MENSQQVFVLLKPDCVAAGLQDSFIQAIEAVGLKVEFRASLLLSREMIEVIYKTVNDQPFYEDLCAFMCSGPCEALIVTGKDAFFEMHQLKKRLRDKHRHTGRWITGEELELWGQGKHPEQHKFNVLLTAANLIHTADSMEETKLYIELCLWSPHK